MNTPTIYDRLAELAFKKIKDELTHEDEQELADIFEKSPEKKALFEELIDPAYMAAKLRIIDEFDVDAAWQEYEKEADAATQQQEPGGDTAWQKYEPDTEPPPKKWPWKQYLTAAVAVGVIFFVYFYLKEEKKTTIVQQHKKVTFDSAVLANGVAMIVQANGSELVIGKEQSGIVATIGNSPVLMTKNVLVLPVIQAGVVIKALPGKQLQIQLSDGTRGWLSGNSELHFTDGFTAGNRTMALKGETYFEVKEGAVPFAVKVPNMELKVLGTWFTIAYDGKTVKTLLYKGKVELTGSGKNIVLTENEEAVFENNEFSRRPLSKMSKEKGNGAKDGLFVFEDDMKTILDEVARYYDCSIEYRGVVPQSPFRCKIDRNMPLESLLENLAEAMVIELNLSGKKIIADFTKHK